MISPYSNAIKWMYTIEFGYNLLQMNAAQVYRRKPLIMPSGLFNSIQYNEPTSPLFEMMNFEVSVFLKINVVRQS